jgi:ABC-type transport system substrate-binding protein
MSDPILSAVTRRHLLAMGTGAAAGLAGCGGQNPNDPTPIGEGPDETPADGTPQTVDEDTVISRINWDFAVGDLNFNVFSGVGNFPFGARFAMFTPMVSYNPLTQEFNFEMADGTPYMEGCELHVKLKENFTYWNGDQVTADDRVIPHNLVPYFCCGGPENVPWEAQKVSKFEFKENKIGVFNDGFAASNMTTAVRGMKEIYRPYLERLDEATTEDEQQPIINELRDLQIGIDQVMEDGLGYGLWKPVDYTTSQLTLEKHDDHPYADRTNIERWQLRVVPTEQSYIQAFKQGRFDYGSGSRSGIQNPPENIEDVVTYEDHVGRKLGMNWRNKHLARRPVRRAINYLLDLEGLAGIVGDVAPVTQQTACLSEPLVEKWVGEDFLDDLISYGPEPQPEKAAQTMRNAGYEKRDGVWTDEDGDRMRGLRFIARSGANTGLLGDTISGQLTDFGIRTEFSSLEGGSFGDIMNASTGSGDFDLVITNAGAGPHPARIWDYANAAIVDDFQRAADISSAEGCGTEAPNVSWYDEGVSPVYEIPTNPAPASPETVGQETLDGEGQRIEPIASSSKLRLDLGEENIKDICRQWAWWVNFNAFHVFLHTQNRRMWLNTDKLQIDDNPVVGGVNYGEGPLSHGSVSWR